MYIVVIIYTCNSYLHIIDNHNFRERTAVTLKQLIIFKFFNTLLLNIVEKKSFFRSDCCLCNILPAFPPTRKGYGNRFFPFFFATGTGYRNSISVYDARRSQDRRSMTIKYKLKTRWHTFTVKCSYYVCTCNVTIAIQLLKWSPEHVVRKNFAEEISARLIFQTKKAQFAWLNFVVPRQILFPSKIHLVWVQRNCNAKL